MEQTECKKCGRRSDFVDMDNCPFCDPNYKPLTLNTMDKKNCKSCKENLPIHQLPSKVSEDGTITNEYHIPMDNNKEEECKNCRNLYSGAIVKLDDKSNCVFCGRKMGSFPSPQSKREGCKQCIDYFQNLGVLPTNIVLGLQENCVLHKNSPQSPVSDWEEKFEKEIIDYFWNKETTIGTQRLSMNHISKIKDFIRQQRLEAYEEGLKERCQNMLSKDETYLKAQLKLAEEIMDYMENGLDEPTDWYGSVKNFLSSRGLLPKITEEDLSGNKE